MLTVREDLPIPARRQDSGATRRQSVASGRVVVAVRVCPHRSGPGLNSQSRLSVTTDNCPQKETTSRDLHRWVTATYTEHSFCTYSVYVSVHGMPLAVGTLTPPPGVDGPW